MMSNIPVPVFNRVDVETVDNEENENILGAEIILANGGEIVAIDVPNENQTCENEYDPNKRIESTGIPCDFAESFVVMLTDGTLKILQSEPVNEAIEMPPESPSLTSDDAHNSYDVLPSQILCSVVGCGKKFLTAAQLKIHQRKHNGMSLHECDFCQKKFSTGYALKAHKRTHTGEKPYTCPELICQKRFKTSGDLQKHIRTHTGERPFKCGVCPKAFTTSNIRKVHMRVHTGEKPYKCTYEGCEKRFPSATNFRNHMRTHTGEKPYVCSIQSCQKRFAEYSSLYKHYTVHSQKKRYMCSFCDRQYRQLSTLNIHINSIHKDALVDLYKNEEKAPDNRISSVYKNIKPVIQSSKSSVISQHLILHQKTGTFVSSPKTVTLREDSGESLASRTFLELQMKNSESFEESRKESEIFFSSIAESDVVYETSPLCDKDETLTPIEFGHFKAITCGSEAILVLAVPSDSGDGSFPADSEEKIA